MVVRTGGVVVIPLARTEARMGVRTVAGAAIRRRRAATVVLAEVITVAQAAVVPMAARVVVTARVLMEEDIAKLG